VSDVKFTPAAQTGLSDRISLNQVDFTAENRSAYSYWDVYFVILLYQRGAIVGANHYTISPLMSGESEAVTMSWPGQFGLLSQVEAIPAVDYLDEKTIIRPEGGSGMAK